MGSDAECETTTTPKLSLYSFPGKTEEPSGMLTPPIYTSASIPFQWEEAPGKPRPCPSTSDTTTTSTQSKPNAARKLELPPRLLAHEAKVTNMPSPTTVLDGPDACRFMSYTLPYRKGGSFRSPDNKRVKAIFGSSRWGSFRKAGRVVQGSFDFSTDPVEDDDNGAQVKIARIRRKGSLSSLSLARSHVLESIYESFKQVVPWRRGREKMKKQGS
ncbi:hypothetical protein PTKIN_Ptkin05aG0095000 [Pterospermum kingtungense]